NGSGNVNYPVAANATGSTRSGMISMGSQTVTITQAPATSCSPAAIQMGATVTGTLSSAACNSQRRPGRYALQYSFSASAGQNISIDMTSTAFDTYLYLVGPGGSVVASDDDGGTGNNSRIPPTSGAFTLPLTGTYIIEATSFATQATGLFSLTLR